MLSLLIFTYWMRGSGKLYFLNWFASEFFHHKLLYKSIDCIKIFSPKNKYFCFTSKLRKWMTKKIKLIVFTQESREEKGASECFAKREQVNLLSSEIKWPYLKQLRLKAIEWEGRGITNETDKYWKVICMNIYYRHFLISSFFFYIFKTKTLFAQTSGQKSERDRFRRSRATFLWWHDRLQKLY